MQNILHSSPTSKGIRSILAREATQRALPEGLDVEHVIRYGSFVASTLEIHSELPRAMELARRQIDSKDREGLSMVSGHTILAKTMTGSKGRFTRSWHAPMGGLWGCMIHANTLLASSRRFIPFAVGIACCETMRAFGADAKLRWVNDVLVDGMKVAGFLVESYTAPVSGELFHLVGFGINLNNSQFPKELENTASSLSQVLGKEIDMCLFAETFLAKLAWNMGLLCLEEEVFLDEDRYSGPNGYHLIVSRFLELTDVIGQQVVYGFDVMEAPQYEAKVLTVDADGGLVLQLPDGYQKTEYSGEVRYLL